MFNMQVSTDCHQLQWWTIQMLKILQHQLAIALLLIGRGLLLEAVF